MVRRLLIILISTSILLSLTACGKSKDHNDVMTVATTEKIGDDRTAIHTDNMVETEKTEEIDYSTTKCETKSNNNSNHSHTYNKKITKPTCTQRGYTTYICDCGYSYVSDYTTSNHSYENYKCTKCGAIDKTKSVEYLSQWLLDNGIAFSEYVYIESKVSSNISVDIRYYPKDNSIAFKYYNNNVDNNGTKILTMIYIYPGSKIAKYISGNDDCKISGDITMNTYTTNYPLSYNSCNPGYYTEYTFVEDTRENINFLLKRTEKLLADNRVGITLSDLGFSSF